MALSKSAGRRSGFFFSVMALAILSLVLLTVQVWVTTFEQSDYRASQRFKGEAVRPLIAAVSDQTLSQFANASAFYATYKLANHTSYINNGLGSAAGSDQANNPGTGNVETVARQLMLEGNSSTGATSTIQYSPDEIGAYTLSGWQAKIGSAASAMGFRINFSSVKNFRYWQIDPWTVGVRFELGMNITDKEGTMRQNKTMKASANFSISGFMDPMISRSDMEHRPSMDRAEKQVFKLDAYNVTADVAPVKLDENFDGNGATPEGNGWFFGQAIESTPDEIATGPNDPLPDLKQYVLVRAYNDSLAGYADQYGAVVVTTQPVVLAVDKPNGCVEETQIKCLNCMKRIYPQHGPAGASCPDDTGWYLFPPYNNPVTVPVIVAGGNFNANYQNMMKVYRAGEGGTTNVERYLLIDNKNDMPSGKMEGYHRIWDITKLRDMSICGFYVKGDGGPSFFQRMLANSQYISNNNFGIESFVVGKWAGGADDTAGTYAADLYSRLDWEFYKSTGGSSINALRIKGMMGCKSEEMCKMSNTNATTVGVGKFRLSNPAINRYGLGEIACPTGGNGAQCN